MNLEPHTTSQQHHRKPVASDATLLAEVRLAAPPACAPDHLAPYVIEADTDDGDWHLTHDTVAFSAPDTIASFTAWRSGWVRTWQLDPLSNVEQLLHLDLEASATQRHPAAATVMSSNRSPNGDIVLGAADMRKVAYSIERTAEQIRVSNSFGVGLVDATPGRHVSGLVRAWPRVHDNQMLSSDHGLAVHLTSEQAVTVTDTSNHEHPVELGAIDRFKLGPEHATLTQQVGDTYQLDDCEARALSLLAPGSADWKIRRIPEILSWARTISALPECARAATELASNVRLTTRRPIAAEPASLAS